MIITRTPLRISLAGGGTDFPDWYLQHGGQVLSTAINKYIYVSLNPSFDGKLRVFYSKHEEVDHVDELQHDLVRECLRYYGITKGVEIGTIADVPSNGTGLGSSSALVVGLMKAIMHYKGELQFQQPPMLASQSCRIELNYLNRPIGKQDQYIAAYGGMQLITFEKSGAVKVEEVLRDCVAKKQLEQELMLFYTGMKRDAGAILQEQKDRIPDKTVFLNEILGQVMPTYNAIVSMDFARFGEFLDYNWQMKKKLASTITTPEIDRLYKRACAAGATGGKLTGAGGGGFLLLHCPEEKQNAVRTALRDLKELAFEFEPTGSEIIFDSYRSLYERGHWE